MTDARLSRVQVEALLKPIPNAIVTRAHVEVMLKNHPDAQISRTHVEVLLLQGTSISGEWAVF